MAAALAALDGDGVGAHLDGFLRMLERAHRRHADNAGVAQTANHFFVRPTAIADRTQLVLDGQVQQLLRVGLEHVEIQAEGLVARQLADADDFRFNLVGGNRGTGQEAEAASIGGGRHQRRTRHPAHGCLHHRIAAAQQVAQGRADRGSCAHALPSFLLACAIDLASCPPRCPAPRIWLCAWAKWW